MVGQKDSGSDSTEPRRSRALPGDRAALWEITGGWRPYLKAVAVDVLGGQVVGKVDPSDVVQETLLRAFRHQDQCRAETDAQRAAWLRAILATTLAELMRRYSAQQRDLAVERSLGAALEETSCRLEGWLAVMFPSLPVIRSETSRP